MLSQETKKEILEKLRTDKDAPAVFGAHDIQGITAKCAEAGYDVTRGDAEELFLAARVFSGDELGDVTGGAGKIPEGPEPGGCPIREAFNQPPY